MNRRQFLRFLPLIPVAIGLVKPVKDVPKPAEGTIALRQAQDVTSSSHLPPVVHGGWGKSNHEIVEAIIARQRLMAELLGQGYLIPPADGHNYSKEELDIIKPITRQLVKEKLDQARLQELLNQKIAEVYAGGGMSPL